MKKVFCGSPVNFCYGSFTLWRQRQRQRKVLKWLNSFSCHCRYCVNTTTCCHDTQFFCCCCHHNWVQNPFHDDIEWRKKSNLFCRCRHSVTINKSTLNFNFHYQNAKFWFSRIPLKHNWHLGMDLDDNNNFSPNAQFWFWNFILRNQKLKKEKWHCSQNVDLNPTCVFYLPPDVWDCV